MPRDHKKAEPESRFSSFSTDSDAPVSHHLDGTEWSGDADDIYFPKPQDDDSPYSPAEPWWRRSGDSSHDRPSTPPPSPPLPSPESVCPPSGNLIGEMDGLLNHVCYGVGTAPLPRDGDRTRYVANARRSTSREDMTRMSLGTFLNNEPLPESRPPSPVNSPAFKDAAQSSRSGSFSALFNKIPLVGRERPRQSSEQDQATRSTTNITGIGTRAISRKPKLFINTTRPSDDAMKSAWSDDSSTSEESKIVSNSSPINREFRAFRAFGQRVQHGAPLHANTHLGEPTAEINNSHRQPMYTLPLQHHQTSTSVTPSQLNLANTTSNTEAALPTSSKEFRVPLKSFSSDNTKALQSPTKGGSSLIGFKGKQKQSKIDLKKEDLKNRNSKDKESECFKRQAIDKMRNEFSAMKENELRTQTNTQIVWYSPNDQRCKHPNHQRTWYSKNIWCAVHTGPCAQCGAPCCAMSSARKIVEENTAPAEVVGNAKALCAAIALHLAVFGRDESTFMECTSCHRLVCPKCCSVCPIAACGDRVCKGPDCNPDGQWEKCDWHDDQ